MNIGIYNPFFDSLSGGERYMLALASHWSREHTVTVFWDDPSMLAAASDRLSLDLSRVTTTPNFFGKRGLLQKLWRSGRYDLIVFLSDGSIPTSLARHNILHFQVPFPFVHIDPFKRSRFQAIVCNSVFTKIHLDPVVGQDAVVIYPPVHTQVKSGPKKQSVIASVGRFHPTKKQDILIEVFAKLLKEKPLKDWKLVLAGGLLPEDTLYMDQLRQQAKNLPIELVANISYEKLKQLYQSAAIYWHAAGYGQSDPQLMEHFGITTVEAMSAGCIPVVYEGGGQPEIVRPHVDGFLWKTVAQLRDQTLSVIKDPQHTASLRRQSALRARDFDQERFFKAFDTLLSRIV